MQNAIQHFYLLKYQSEREDIHFSIILLFLHDFWSNIPTCDIFINYQCTQKVNKTCQNSELPTRLAQTKQDKPKNTLTSIAWRSYWFILSNFSSPFQHLTQIKICHLQMSSIIPQYVSVVLHNGQRSLLTKKVFEETHGVYKKDVRKFHRK